MLKINDSESSLKAKTTVFLKLALLHVNVSLRLTSHLSNQPYAKTEPFCLTDYKVFQKTSIPIVLALS